MEAVLFDRTNTAYPVFIVEKLDVYPVTVAA